MTRRKNHKRSQRRKQDVKDQSLNHTSGEPSSLALDKTDGNIEDDALNESIDMDFNTSDPNLRTPETVMHNSDCLTDPLQFKDLSPTIRMRSRSTTESDLKNLDCDVEQILNLEPSTKINMSLENVAFDKCNSEVNLEKVERVEVEPVYTNLNDYLLDKTVTVDSEIKIDLELNRCVDEEKISYSDDKIDPPVFKKNPTFDLESQTYDLNSRFFTFQGSHEQRHSTSIEDSFKQGRNWYGKKLEILPSSEQLKILKMHSKPGRAMRCSQKKNIKNFSSRDIEDDEITNCSRSSSPPAKRSRTALRFENENRSNLTPSTDHPQVFNFVGNKKTIPSAEDDSEYAISLKTRWESSSSSPASVDLPTVSDLDGKASVSEVKMIEKVATRFLFLLQKLFNSETFIFSHNVTYSVPIDFQIQNALTAFG